MFADMGFHTIMKTKDVLFMENRSQGIVKFLELLKKEIGLDAESIADAIICQLNQ